MFLEHDDIGVRNLLCVRCREDWCSSVVDRINDHGGCGGQHGQQRKAEEAFHDGLLVKAGDGVGKK